MQDEDFQAKLAKLLSAVGVELIYGWTAVRELYFSCLFTNL